MIDHTHETLLDFFAGFANYADEFLVYDDGAVCLKASLQFPWTIARRPIWC
jgi:hypothetical protein